MVGNIARQIARQALPGSRPKVSGDVWVINGAEEQRTESTKAVSLAALSSWDSAKSGRFLVERNEVLFEAMGNPVTGIIVHRAADLPDESQWRVLGSILGNAETEIRFPALRI